VEGTNEVTTYMIVRFYKDDEELNRTRVMHGLTLEQAQAHCNDPESSSSTATGAEAVARTREHGDWFDGFEEE
jgi:hypothetical protein